MAHLSKYVRYNILELHRKGEGVEEIASRLNVDIEKVKAITYMYDKSKKK